MESKDVVTPAIERAEAKLAGLDLAAADLGSNAADLAHAINPSGSSRGRNALADDLASVPSHAVPVKIIPAPAPEPIAAKDELPDTLAGAYELGFERGVELGRCLARTDTLREDVHKARLRLAALRTRTGEVAQ